MALATLKYPFAVLWAVAVGGAVTLSLCGTVIINNNSPSAGYNGFYVGTMQIATQVCLLVPQAFCRADPCQRLPQKWPLMGGLVSVVSFIAIPAGGALGAQAVLLSQLAGMLSGAVVLDLWSGKLRLSDVKQWVGFAVILSGSILDALSAGGAKGQGNSLALYVFYAVGVYVVGVGYTFQANCNATMATPLGSAVRATLLTNIICVCVSAPAWAYLQAVAGIQPVLALHDDWPLWLGAGACGVLYNYSFAVLPQIIGYTMTYFIILASKLAFSSATDAVGLMGVTVPFTRLRAAAIALVLIGTILFAWPAKSSTLADDDCGQTASSSAPLTSEGPSDKKSASE